MWARLATTALGTLLLAAVSTSTLPGAAESHESLPGLRTIGVTTAADPTGPPRDQPNVVLVMTDDMRDDDLAHMPLTRRLLGEQGMEFTDAVSPHPLCCPARAELVTGQYAQNNGVQHNKGTFGGFEALGPSPEISSWFRAEGYATAFVGKFLNGYGPSDTPPAGWTRWDALQTGVYDYLDFSFANDGVPETYSGSYVTEQIARRTNATVSRLAEAGEPFLLYSWHLAPHYRLGDDGEKQDPPAAPQDRGLFRDALPPSLADPAFDEADVDDQPAVFRDRRPVDRAAVVSEHRSRLRSLQSVDRAVASLVETLRVTGELDNTFLVFTSDNGYSLGEHRFVGKNVLTHEALQVPLLVRGPGIPAGTTSSLPVSLVDLPTTFAGLAGVDPGLLVDGASLVPTLTGQPQAFRDTMLVQVGDDDLDGWSLRGVRTDRYLYARDGADGVLYDALRDPHELVNRFADPDYVLVRAALERRRTELVGCAGWACNQSFGPVPEPLASTTAPPPTTRDRRR